MKNHILFAIGLILIFAFAINAQNYNRLENLADVLSELSDELANRTSNNIKRGDSNPRTEIERAFLAEQLFASSKLLKRLVDDKYSFEDLRSAGGILSAMVRQFPTDGSNSSNWRKAQDAISAINRELQNTSDEIIDKNPGEILGRVFWTGMVDATVHLVIQGSNVETRTVLGTPYPDGLPSFTKTLPRSGTITIGVNKKTGRGDVRVIQQPNSRNNYTAIVEIHDEGGGAKSYTVEVFWF